MQRFSQSDPSPHSCQRVTFSCLSRPAGVAATEYRTNSDVTIVRCTYIVPIVSCQIRMLTARNKLASAEDNGVVIHNPLALTHTLIPCRPAYLEAWRQFPKCLGCSPSPVPLTIFVLKLFLASNSPYPSGIKNKFVAPVCLW